VRHPIGLERAAAVDGLVEAGVQDVDAVGILRVGINVDVVPGALE